VGARKIEASTSSRYAADSEAGEDAPEAFQSAEEPLDLVAFAVHGFVVLPRFETVAFGWDHGDEGKIQRQLPGFIVFLGTVHDQMQWSWQGPMLPQKFPSLNCVGCLTWREREGYGRPSIRGNHMNLGGPSAAGFSDGLGPVFF
jgi:hypothetical protein